LVGILRQQVLDRVVDDLECISLFGVRVVQPWLRQREVTATLANLVEGALDLFFFQTKNRRIHATDPLLWKARVPAVFTKSTHIAFALFSHHHQSPAGAADSHDA